MKTSDKIIQLIKREGALTAKTLASELGITSMGARQHLQQLEDEGILSFEDKKAARGRPTRYWSLTEKSRSFFPDRHSELTLQMIGSIKEIFGPEGLEQLIIHREKASFESYQQALAGKFGLADKLRVLVELRSQEGYMASLEQRDGVFWLLENHCPICAAASQCLSFCRSELQLFEQLLSEQATVTREEHILEGARRCAYRITPVRGSVDEELP
ncbi:helix-turn-helix transcriptional regulator [Dongshaea marina]|uniref:helix-turn-helix transcriptional regulator n=1 Tax=Dongshaea marina TaxID=2047966 RepID=UPI000D3EA037|nr:metalloregulator ArsR/SmtB family transcription factor [Dongshaea marina]